MIIKRSNKAFQILGLVLLFNVFFLIFGSQSAQARVCGVDSGNVHDYAGLMVNMRWQHNGGGAYFDSDNTKVRLNTIGDVSTSPGGIVYLNGGSEQDRKDSSTFQQKDHPGCEYNSANGDNHMVLLGYEGSSRRDVEGDGRADSWVIDCDSSIRDPDNNGSHPGWDSKYQRIRVSAVGIPTGAKSGGEWHVYGGTQPFADVAPANGFTEKVTLVYEEPPDTEDPESDCNIYKKQVYGSSAHRVRVYSLGTNLSVITSPSDGSQHTTRDLTNDGVANISWANNLPPPVYEKYYDPVINDHEEQIGLKNLGASDSGWKVLYERWQPLDGDDSGDYRYYRDIKTITNCHTADIDGPGVDCSSVSIQADARPPGGNSNSVRAGSNFRLTGVVRNTGSSSSPIKVVVIDGGGMPGSEDVVGTLGPGHASGFDIPMSAINDVSHRVVTIVPQYNGSGFEMGARCYVEVDTYQYFSIVPIASLNGALNDNENPTSINYNYGGTKQSGPDTVSTGSYSIVKAGQTSLDPTNIQPGDIITSLNGPNATNLAYQNQNIATTYNNANIRSLISPGERFCVTTTIDEATGWLGPHGKVGQAPLSRDSCERLVNKPYVRFYGQDVYAGGNFPGNPTESNGIRTNNRISGIGSGVEYAAYSIGAITQDASKNLNFAENSLKAVVRYPTASGIGGSHVATDYYANLPICVALLGGSLPASPPCPALGAGSLITSTDEAMKAVGGVTLQTSVIPLSASKTLFVDGDVVIAGNITYADWGGNLNAIPNFKLVVRGNIYITSNVTIIDGLLVAQPRSGQLEHTGRIHTCVSTDGSPADLTSNGTTFGECNAPLVINGAVVAQKIFWQRTGWTLSSALSGGREPYNSNTAAEVINTSPDFYLGNPADPPSGGGSSGKYDSYQQLPPIL